MIEYLYVVSYLGVIVLFFEVIQVFFDTFVTFLVNLKYFNLKRSLYVYLQYCNSLG